MSLIRSESIPLTYEWYQEMPILTWNWTPSEKFTIEGVPDCEFYSRIRLVKSKASDHETRVSVSVVKTNPDPARAEIIVIFGDDVEKLMEEFDDWTESCEFPPQPFFSDVDSIRFTLLWHGPVNISSAKPQPSNLHDEIKPFLMKPSLSDVKIIVDNHAIYAHKLILGAHSPVFLNMFETNMKDERESRVFIEDTAADVMKNVLTYLYTGSDASLNDWEMTLKMLAVAERYDMKKLKNLCEYKLSKNLCPSNALEILDGAHTHNAKNLLDDALHFIVKHKQKVIDTENFETLCYTKPHLMLLLTKEVLSD